MARLPTGKTRNNGPQTNIAKYQKSNEQLFGNLFFLYMCRMSDRATRQHNTRQQLKQQIPCTHQNEAQKQNHGKLYATPFIIVVTICEAAKPSTADGQTFVCEMYQFPQLQHTQNNHITLSRTDVVTVVNMGLWPAWVRYCVV
jgi:hypothetical protein